MIFISIVAKELLAPDGSIYVHLDEHMSHYARVILDEVFGKERFVSEIIWSFGRIGGNAKKYEKNHEVIFWYSNTKSYIFNKDAARQPYDAAFLATCKKDEEGRLYYTRGMGKDGEKLNRKKVSYINPLGKSPSNVWEGIVYSPTSKYEKTGYPTQKPEELIKRIIVASTNEEDIVLDFFGGSGTTAAVAEKLNRRWIVCDIGKLSFYTMQKRILEIAKSKSLVKKSGKYGKEAKPFFTCSLGLYDLKNTLEMEFDKYKEFVAELFEINIKTTVMSGYEFDGKKDSSFVKIFNYQKFKDADVDEDYIHNIHNIVGDKVGGKVYIVAPLNRIEFITEYYEIENVRYYFLKIPYEIIKELHQKPFQKYRQPKSINNVNSLDEAIGFHFIRKPEVISEIIHKNNKYELVIKKFVSNELETVKNSDEKGIEEMDYLAAVFVDTKYNDNNFIMTAAYFADDFEKRNNNLCVKLKGVKPRSNVALIYTDIYGNDYTEIVSLED
jgi:DNA modification methylase